MTLAPGQHKKYWFPPKRVGLGWGAPISWQGWVTFGAYIAIIGVSGVISPLLIAIDLVPLTAVFVVIVFRTGDPAGRHWVSRRR